MPICNYFPECGGCDFLNLDLAEYKTLKQNLLNKPEADWIWISQHSRRKIILQIDGKNRCGFFAKKSNDLVEISQCIASEKEISNLLPHLKLFLSKQEQNLFENCVITLFDNGLDLVFSVRKAPNLKQNEKFIIFAKEHNLNISYKIKNQITAVYLARKNQIFYPDFKIDLDSDIFIQATKSGLEAISKTIRNFLNENKNIKNIADIYAGFGAYSFAISDLAKSISAFEGSKKMVDLINKNAAGNNLSQKIKADVCDLFSSPITAKDLNKFDLVIINPPRNGASPQALEIAKSKVKNLIYVSCNPQSFERDYKILSAENFAISKLTALDQFYGTKHLELVVLLQR